MKTLERRLYGSNYFLKTHQNLKFLAIKTQKYLEITTDGNVILLQNSTKRTVSFWELTPPIGKTSKVNSIQSTPAGKNKSKKGKGKNKEDKNNLQSKKANTQPVDPKDKCKP
jgi:hypothetical protein